jgi:hypothetical protein
MKRHPVDSVALVFALLFSAAITWWGVATVSDDPFHVPAAWVGAGTLLVIGLVGLVSALRPDRELAPAGPMTVMPEPQPALRVEPDPYADLYTDPYFHAATLNVGAGVLDPETVAAAYRDAGFEDADRLPTAPIPTVTPEEPPVRGTEPEADPDPDPDAVTAEAQRDEAAPTVEIPPKTLVDPVRPTDRDGGTA